MKFDCIQRKDTHFVGRSFEGFIPASMIILSVQ